MSSMSAMSTGNAARMCGQPPMDGEVKREVTERVDALATNLEMIHDRMKQLERRLQPVIRAVETSCDQTPVISEPQRNRSPLSQALFELEVSAGRMFTELELMLTYLEL
ncbi:MAG: hypothetical protein WCY34_02835 [Candidatus Omnitrophota bacterium]